MSLNIGILSSAYKPSGGGVDADAQAFFNRVAAAGGTLSATEQIAVNTLVISLKAANVWSLMKAIYPMVGASAAACAQNLKSSSFTSFFNGIGWTFANTGVKPAGNTYCETFFNFFTETTGFSQHISMYSRTQNTTGQSEIGAYDGTVAISLFQYYTGLNLKGGSIYNYPTTSVTINNTNTKGFQIVNRTANNLAKLYFNGSILVTNTNTETSTRPSKTVYLGCTHWPGVPPAASQFGLNENSFTSLGDGLTDTQASDFYTIVQAFQTTLSRQV